MNKLKAAVFPLYMGAEVELTIHGTRYTGTLEGISPNTYDYSNPVIWVKTPGNKAPTQHKLIDSGCQLLLRPIESISEALADELSTILGISYSEDDESAEYDLTGFKELLKDFFFDNMAGMFSLIEAEQAISILRREGYNLPYLGKSLVSEGVVKLKA